MGHCQEAGITLWLGIWIMLILKVRTQCKAKTSLQKIRSHYCRETFGHFCGLDNVHVFVCVQKMITETLSCSIIVTKRPCLMSKLCEILYIQHEKTMAQLCVWGELWPLRAAFVFLSLLIHSLICSGLSKLIIIKFPGLLTWYFIGSLH